MSFGKFLGCVVSTTFVIAPTLGTTYLALHKDVTLMDSESPNIVLGERKEPNEPTTVNPTEKPVEVKSSSEKSDTEDSQTEEVTTSEDSKETQDSPKQQEQTQPVTTEDSGSKEEGDEEATEQTEEEKSKQPSLKLEGEKPKSNITIAPPDVILEALVKSLVKISENAVRAIR